ncbi:homoserine dehydrogenase [Calderihabitans maritimus]|uniref:Homoserine dehydrogenase n=1 Tax=Calderihabitans maritimus TaxID=1246530 RepID=A0A1Z5HUM9_9FIRM|nr:homoserine dehydrogenase [Calderihabitans maritimus]GAW93246.1 homoserine dehydrogenase [Calderihabitans maritimus]
MSKDSVQIGLLGLGTVGTGVLKVLTQNSSDIEQKVGKKIEVKKILVRDINKPRRVEVDPSLLTTEVQDILEDEDIDIVVEVMGGIEPAKDYVLEALHRGKNVVTANKDLLAEYGKELFEASAEHSSDLFFEASVAGGIPIIRPLKECLAGNRIEEVMGIINGTTNYILTKMTTEGSDFEEVLKQAQELGYAEADPTADVKGYDAARKIAILASIAFGTRVTFRDVYVEGITEISREDIEYARELGYVIKLLGIAREKDGVVEVRVHPALIPVCHPLAAVNDVFNAVFVRGDAVGEAMFYGRGAGELPTASAVVGDIIEVARDLNLGVTGRIACTCFTQKRIKPIGEVETKFYLRLKVKDQPGVLAGIASVFGNMDVSLASVIQKRREEDWAEIVLITHQVQEKNLRDALTIIRNLSTVDSVGNVIRVEGSED